ncbi:hypothetical protein [Salinirubrum litoreum]|uniref:Uncharacterized protein n=1 Tax=Salinirubrum litoreum TaxID=1126234 RepID=A0ABD5R6B0_9EURY|nr:hypothetical protein [Salinirubrum litoreum]
MRRRGSPTRGTSSRTRRGLLLAGVAALGLGGLEAGAYTSADLNRSNSLGVATDIDGVLGLDAPGSVSANKRGTLATITNHLSADSITVTVSLATASEGTLYTATDSGSSVTLSLLADESATVEAETTLGRGDTLAWSVSASGPATTLRLDRTSSVTRGNVKAAIRFKKLAKLRANAGKGEFTVGQAQAQDRDGDDDLDRVEYLVTDPSGTEVASATESVPGNGKQYKARNLTIDTTENVQRGTTYTITATAFDADGNTARESGTVTA